MEDRDFKTRKFGKLSDTLTVGIFTALGYFSAFTYLRGYSDYFGLPSYLIEVNITDILVATFSIFIFSYILITVVNVLFHLFEIETAKNRAILNALMMVVFTVFISSLLIPEKKQAFITSLVLSSFFVLLEFGFPLFFHRKKPTLEEKFIEQENIEKEVKLKSLFYKFDKSFGLPLSSYVFLFFLVAALSYSLGSNTAREKEFFLTTDTQPKLVIVQTYKDSLVAIQLDPTNTQFGNKIIFFVANETPILSIEQLNIRKTSIDCEADFFNLGHC